MRTNLKPKAYIYPLPVLVIGTYDANDVPNAMTAAWGCVCDRTKVSIIIDMNHKTAKNILRTKEFTVAITDLKTMVEADFVGIVSGNDYPNKLEKTNWTVTKSNNINAPIFVEFPLVLECKLDSIDQDKEMFIGEVVNVSCDDSILTNGRVDLNKFTPICYDTDTHGYYTLGKRVGDAFTEGEKIK